MNKYKYILSIDNGISGNMAIIKGKNNLIHFGHVPIKNELNYTGRGRINRIDNPDLIMLLNKYKGEAFAVCEYPFCKSC